MRLARLIAAAILAAAPAIAAAQNVIAVGKFNAVELHGGGAVTIRQGPVQRVTVIQDSSGKSQVEVVDRDRGGKLILSACRGSCWGRQHFEVEIVTPSVSAVAISGGGHIQAVGPFSAQGAVSAVIHGGGGIDLKAMPAQSVSAQVHGGGKITVAAQNSLSAAINGGGSIRYLGQPAISSSIHGGGSVDSLR